MLPLLGDGRPLIDNTPRRKLRVCSLDHALLSMDGQHPEADTPGSRPLEPPNTAARTRNCLMRPRPAICYSDVSQPNPLVP